MTTVDRDYLDDVREFDPRAAAALETLGADELHGFHGVVADLCRMLPTRSPAEVAARVARGLTAYDSVTVDRLRPFGVLLSEYRPKIRAALDAGTDLEEVTDDVLTLLAQYAAEGPSSDGSLCDAATAALTGLAAPTRDSGASYALEYAGTVALVSIAGSLDAMRRFPEFVTAMRCVPQVAMLLEQLNYPPERKTRQPQPGATTLAEVEEAVRPYADILVASGAESDLTGAYHRIGSLLSQWAEPELDPAF